jgi:fatty acid desaturase
MSKRRPVWSRCVIGSHIVVVLALGALLAQNRSGPWRVILTFISGTSLFVLTGLVHEASHHLLARRAWLNDLLGNLAGTLLATPVSAYRALHLKHHQTTNRDDDPNKMLRSRWMILFGVPTYIFLTHSHAWHYMRGRPLFRYLAEMALMAAVVVAGLWLLPRPIREWSLLGPLMVVGVLQNVRIVTGHMDLPSGKYDDTWQLVLPGWLSVWLLHYDHHLEHHVRPRMVWHELPGLRTKLADTPGLPLHRVTLPQFFLEVFFTRGYVAPTTSGRVERGDVSARREERGPGADGKANGRSKTTHFRLSGQRVDRGQKLG